MTGARAKRLRWFIPLMLAVAMPVIAAPAPHAKVFGAAVAAQGVWFASDSTARRGDAEAGLSARASLSPHISLVGSGFYGGRGQYVRYAGGVRVTATDAQDADFSIGIGYQYRGSSDARLKPDEWGPDVTLGWRPWPGVYPNLLLNLHSWYGIGSGAGAVSVGIRYALPI